MVDRWSVRAKHGAIITAYIYIYIIYTHTHSLSLSLSHTHTHTLSLSLFLSLTEYLSLAGEIPNLHVYTYNRIRKTEVHSCSFLDISHHYTHILRRAAHIHDTHHIIECTRVGHACQREDSGLLCQQGTQRLHTHGDIVIRIPADKSKKTCKNKRNKIRKSTMLFHVG